MKLQDIIKTSETTYVNHSGDGTFYGCDITLEIDGNKFKAESVTEDSIEGAVSLNGVEFKYCLLEYMHFKFDDEVVMSLSDIILCCFDETRCGEFMKHDAWSRVLDARHNQSLRVGG